METSNKYIENNLEWTDQCRIPPLLLFEHCLYFSGYFLAKLADNILPQYPARLCEDFIGEGLPLSDVELFGSAYLNRGRGLERQKMDLFHLVLGHEVLILR